MEEIRRAAGTMLWIDLLPVLFCVLIAVTALGAVNPGQNDVFAGAISLQLTGSSVFVDRDVTSPNSTGALVARKDKGRSGDKVHSAGLKPESFKPPASIPKKNHKLIPLTTPPAGAL